MFEIYETKHHLFHKKKVVSHMRKESVEKNGSQRHQVLKMMRIWAEVRSYCRTLVLHTSDTDFDAQHYKYIYT